MTSGQVPYISVVVAARNDNHGGDMLPRMQAFLDSWMFQAAQYVLPSEIVVVEWNPPVDRGPLSDELHWPDDQRFCPVRFIQVSREIHGQLPNEKAIPLHQMIAKNVGIRRARGRFVLATNLDIIFSAELMRYLAERCLNEGAMYRMDRYDVARNIPSQASVDDLLAYCQGNILRVFTRAGRFVVAEGCVRLLEPVDVTTPEAGIRFGPGWYEPEESDRGTYRWLEKEAELLFDRPPGITGRLLLDIETGPSAWGEPVRLTVADPAGNELCKTQVEGRHVVALSIPAHFTGGMLLVRVQGRCTPVAGDPRILHVRVFRVEWEEAAGNVAETSWQLEVIHAEPTVDWTVYGPSPSPFAAQIRNAVYLHTNACGDFTMLSQKAWSAVRGYAEVPIWPMHIDSLLCYAAHHAGFREVILNDPMRIFHIEHFSGAGWTPEGEKERNARIEAKGVLQLQYSEFTQWVDQMRRLDAPIIMAREDWGLGNLELPETTIA